MVFSYSWRTVNDETTTWRHRWDQYYEIGKYDVHMRQILISAFIMLFVSISAFGYVKTSVTRDFALLAGGDSGRSRTRGGVQSRAQDTEALGLTGGLEIQSDAAE